MAALLQTAGPFSSHRAINTGWRFLRLVTIKQFKEAAMSLQQIGLGSMVQMTRRNHPSVIFVKSSPSDAALVLPSNMDLCTPEYYMMRYKQPITKSISRGVREKLVMMGLMTPEML